MLELNARVIERLAQATIPPGARVQRLEDEQAALLARLEGERHFRILTTHISEAAKTILPVGTAVEEFAQAMRSPLRPPRRLAGGLARARTAWRHPDGTFVTNVEVAVLEAEREDRQDSVGLAQYDERYPAGGRARAKNASRYAEGAFA